MLDSALRLGRVLCSANQLITNYCLTHIFNTVFSYKSRKLLPGSYFSFNA